MAIWMEYSYFLLPALCLVLPLVSTQTLSPDSVSNTSSVSNPVTTQVEQVTDAVTTHSPTPPLLPETEGQADFYVYKTVDEKLVPCSRTTFLAELSMQYPNIDGGLATLDLTLPHDAQVDGECGDRKSSLSLQWDGTDIPVHTLNFTFLTKPPSDTGPQFSTWILGSVSLTCDMDSDEFRNPLEGGRHTLFSDPDSSYFETALGLSFSCDKEQHIILKPVDNSSSALYTATVTLMGLRTQPFQLLDTGEFAQAASCDDVETPPVDDQTGSSSHTAAIAIATVLCIVIVGSLVTYYCVKRSQKTRYTSME